MNIEGKLLCVTWKGTFFIEGKIYPVINNTIKSEIGQCHTLVLERFRNGHYYYFGNEDSNAVFKLIPLSKLEKALK